MRGGAVAKLATFTGSAVLVGGPVAGTLYFLLPSTSVSGSGRANNPRFVMARVKETDPELSFAYDSFFKGGGAAVGKPVPFKDANISFDGYKLKEGDILCSPQQNGKFYMLEEVTGRGKAVSTYKIKGYDHSGTITRCNLHDFPAHIRKDESKTIELKGLRNYQARNSYSAGIDTIYVSSCSFELKKKDNQFSSDANWGIAWNHCKQNEYGKNPWDFVPTTQLGVNYEIK
ncbi:hypothetical protein WEN_01115 [Mycoplasma wenyonii str. Massachusetts]|uniref:Uncharacterized protein n=1 Tax=Mycoplasma wenyonii (strain Massachusetts) TaxID=1197325 RepID=I6ZEK3_MYCWM|nr:hypothetical protein [Mycoplasma wenyonii]AFN65022.1 hypothetical protein WEN_01115 [Mycoplasma wenyonii str. Massachusetts]